MNESTILATKTFTCSASLAAVGIKLAELQLFEPIAQWVQIAQKTIKDRPSDKLYDAFISILAGAHGLVEINTRLRAVQPLTVVDNSISPSRLTILHDLAYGIFEASHPLNFTS